MICEICGKNMLNGRRIELEGSNVVVCDDCTSYGKVVGRVGGEKPDVNRIILEKAKPVEFDIGSEEGIVEDCGRLIRSTRERRDMKQEELAKKINEPASLVHRIESGKIVPSPVVARKISKVLDLKLFRKNEDIDANVKRGRDDELTLGDVIVVKKSKGKK